MTAACSRSARTANRPASTAAGSPSSMTTITITMAITTAAATTTAATTTTRLRQPAAPVQLHEARRARAGQSVQAAEGLAQHDATVIEHGAAQYLRGGRAAARDQQQHRHQHVTGAHRLSPVQSA